jgi:DNA polymerase sigma
MQDFRKAALELEGEKAGALSEIDFLNNEILVSAAAKKKSDKAAKEQVMRNNLAALGAGVQEGSIPLREYLDYYKKMSSELDADEDLAYIQQHDNIARQYADEYKKIQKEELIQANKLKGIKGISGIFEKDGKYYKLGENGEFVEVPFEEYKKHMKEKQEAEKRNKQVQDMQKWTIAGS